jgi:serine/threonine-protein kinase TTK/MPS1
MYLIHTVQVFREEGLIYMVLEYGDIDLARLLHNHEEARRRARGGGGGGGGEGAVPAVDMAGAAAEGDGRAVELDDNFIRLYWQQMLQVGGSVCALAAHWLACAGSVKR